MIWELLYIFNKKTHIEYEQVHQMGYYRSSFDNPL